MATGDAILAGKSTTAEGTTDLVADSTASVDFAGGLILRVGPQAGALAPRHEVDGIQGTGIHGGAGVLGVGGVNQGPGVMGFGGGGVLQSLGGTGVWGGGGKASRAAKVDAGVGVIGVGGEAFADIRSAGPAMLPSIGVLALSGGADFPPSASFGINVGIGVVGLGGLAGQPERGGPWLRGGTGLVGMAGGIGPVGGMSGLEAFGVVGVGGPPTTAQEISQGWPKLAAGTGVLGLAGGVSGPANIDDAGVVGVGGPPQPNTPPQSDPLGAFGGPGVVGLAGGVGTPSNLDISATGVYGQGPYCGVRAVGGSYGIYASVQNVSSGAAGYFNGTVSVGGELWAGNTHIIGNFTVYGGSKSVAVPFPDGTHRLLYCLESPECWFEDFGEAKLVKGKAEVKLTREFATLIKKDSYHVFLTPYGHSHGLYVSSRTGASFVVKEQNEGKSTLKFSYRIVGKRKDVKAERFAKVTAPKLPEPPSAAVTKEKGKAKRKA